MSAQSKTVWELGGTKRKLTWLALEIDLTAAEALEGKAGRDQAEAERCSHNYSVQMEGFPFPAAVLSAEEGSRASAELLERTQRADQISSGCASCDQGLYSS